MGSQVRKDAWQPMLKIAAILTTFKDEIPKIDKADKSKMTPTLCFQHLCAYTEATSKVIEELGIVISDMAGDIHKEMEERCKLDETANSIKANQAMNDANQGIQVAKNQLIESMCSFTVHNFDSNLIPDSANIQKKCKEIFKIPSIYNNHVSFRNFKKRGSQVSTLIVKCSDFLTKSAIESCVKTSHKTSINFPRYVHHFVKKIRPLYVNLGKKIDNNDAIKPFIFIKPNSAGDKLIISCKDPNESNAQWKFVECINIPYPVNIIESGHVTQTCKSKYLKDDEIKECCPPSFSFLE